MAFWAKQTQNGETYHEGKLGGATVRLFLNGYKKSDRDPDVIMYLSQTPFNKDKAKPQAQGQAQAPRITPRPQAQAKPAYKDWTKQEEPPQNDAPWPTEEELPF